MRGEDDVEQAAQWREEGLGGVGGLSGEDVDSGTQEMTVAQRWARASISTTAPREALIRKLPCAWSISASPIRPRVAGVSGTCSETRSAVRRDQPG